jgi:hypothetical protein
LPWKKELELKSALSAGFLVVGLIFIIALPGSAPAQTPGSAPSLAAPAGSTLTDIVECGEGYTSHELYDMKIALLEVIRGEEAWKRIREASSANKPAESGSEFVLARVRFEYQARALPGLCVHPLLPEQFMAYSADGEDYRPASVVPPKPEMRKELKSGESFEGWLAFMVAQQDKAPLMSYSAGTGGAVQHGGNKWFILR